VSVHDWERVELLRARDEDPGDPPERPAPEDLISDAELRAIAARQAREEAADDG
jgi:hypothetical protein